MHARYHRQLTTQVLQGKLRPEVLETVIAANLGQDGLLGLIGHPEFHFDDNAFASGQAYIDAQRRQALDVLHSPVPSPLKLRLAWQAIGRLLHAAQDFYAHSNYAFLWLDSHPDAIPEEIVPLDLSILESPSLRSGRVYYLREFLSYIPPLRPLALRLLPRDAHAWMNLDGPERGPLFAYALRAAHKRSQVEVGKVIDPLDPAQVSTIT
jgi:hypothetical protein